jgi:hypothetical protein
MERNIVLSGIGIFCNGVTGNPAFQGYLDEYGAMRRWTVQGLDMEYRGFCFSLFSSASSLLFLLFIVVASLIWEE